MLQVQLMIIEGQKNKMVTHNHIYRTISANEN
jgi:hypothetical protein